jgi:small subunit ribosomal protein S7|uniref:Ribosomal protein S7 n=1 Tax=Pelagomonas calceolata TaxID=35677 RepID=A0A7U0KSS8_9STRA|nr:ribosomal protein S7 [Pelagomonas calceolata]QQW50384.1 ribosomal protein S7 [Pelagomonas calceolata]|tara:strand:+ start:947 stop:1381 length:435 start_codon:yes stop_codon:yes gene_type:complete
MVTKVSNKKLLELLTLSLTKKGNKHVAELIVSDLFLVLRKQYKVFPYTTLHQAVDKVKPLTGFRNVKLRGSSYKIPFFLEEDQQLKMALSWLVSSAKKSKSKISTSLAKELIQASTGQGDLIKKRNEIHKYANQNKVFAHYRWF